MTESTTPDSASPSLTMLVSSVSARGRALHEGREVVRILRSAGWQVEAIVTTQQDELGELVAGIDADLIGAVGGDGYLATVAHGVAQLEGKTLLPFPGGRGNDLCRSLGVGTSPTEHARTLADLTQAGIAERLRPLDGMWVETLATGEKRLALGLVSFGIDALANEVANRSWFRSGPMAYAWGALTAFVKYRFADCQGSIDGQRHDLSGWLTSISNTGWFGGGINLVAQSDSSDGVLEVINVGRTGRWKVAPLLASVLGQRNLDSPLVHLYEGKDILIESPAGFGAMADGDVVGHVPLRITVAPQAVQLLI